MGTPARRREATKRGPLAERTERDAECSADPLSGARRAPTAVLQGRQPFRMRADI